MTLYAVGDVNCFGTVISNATDVHTSRSRAFTLRWRRSPEEVERTFHLTLRKTPNCQPDTTAAESRDFTARLRG